MTVSEIMRAAVGLLRRLGGDGVAALLLVTVGTNLLDFASKPAPGASPGPGFVVSAAVRVLLVFWIGYVVQRRIVGVGGRATFSLGLPFGRFAALQIATLAGMIALRALLFRISPPAPGLAGEWGSNLLALTAWSLLSIRLLACNAALSVGATFAELAPVWRGQRGHDPAIAGGFLALVLPAAALHLAFTLIAVKIPMAPAPLAFLAVADGLVSAAQLALACAIGAIALRLASLREPR